MGQDFLDIHHFTRYGWTEDLPVQLQDKYQESGIEEYKICSTKSKCTYERERVGLQRERDQEKSILARQRKIGSQELL